MEDMETDSQSGRRLPPNAVLEAVNSLYEDELKPNIGLVRRRVKELYDVLLPTTDLRKLVQRLVDAKVICAEGDAQDPVLRLPSRPADSFIDPMDPREPYDEEIFQQLQALMDAVAAQDPNRLYKGGRYGMAQQLRSQEMPELQKFTLGRVSQIVQRAIAKKIVGYKKGGSLVPYRLSDSFLKNNGTPESRENLLAVDIPTIRTMAEMREVLTVLWMNPENHQGLPLSLLKEEIRKSAKRSLSEHLLGFGKLSQLFTAPELEGCCELHYDSHDVLLCPPSLVSASWALTKSAPHGSRKSPPPSSESGPSRKGPSQKVAMPAKVV